MEYLTNDDRFSMATENIDDGKEITNMCEALDIIEARGEKRGILKALSDLVKDGILTISDAARRAGMSESAFISESGIKPEKT